jgi:hypothetical protein
MIIDSPRRREQLRAIAARLPAHVARLAWSSEEIAAERQRALRETLSFAKAKSPGMPSGSKTSTSIASRSQISTACRQ